MEKKGVDLFAIINLLVAIFAVLIPAIFFYLTSSEEIKTQTYVIFGVMAVVLLLGVFMIYIISKWKQMVKDIKLTKSELGDIKKELNFKDMWNKMEIRLNVLEALYKKDKRGQVLNPYVIWWILILILLYLFLKSIGIFN